MDFLATFLNDGPKSVTAVESEAAKRGISKRTLERAKSELALKIDKSGFRGGWTWALARRPPKPVDTKTGGLRQFPTESRQDRQNLESGGLRRPPHFELGESGGLRPVSTETAEDGDLGDDEDEGGEVELIEIADGRGGVNIWASQKIESRPGWGRTWHVRHVPAKTVH